MPGDDKSRLHVREQETRSPPALQTPWRRTSSMSSVVQHHHARLARRVSCEPPPWPRSTSRFSRRTCVVQGGRACSWPQPPPSPPPMVVAVCGLCPLPWMSGLDPQGRSGARNPDSEAPGRRRSARRSKARPVHRGVHARRLRGSVAASLEAALWGARYFGPPANRHSSGNAPCTSPSGSLPASPAGEAEKLAQTVRSSSALPAR